MASILIVDDSQDIRTQLEVFLKSGGFSNLTFSESATDAFKKLNMDNHNKMKNDIDIILMDIKMPEIDGIEACRRIKSHEKLQDIPVIMVTGNTDPNDIQISFEAGAVDYVTKPLNKVELLARLNSTLKLKYEMDRRKEREIELVEAKIKLEDVNKMLNQANEKLEDISVTDGLTGISNRRFFDDYFKKEWYRSLRYSRPLSLIMIDIDFFKIYNDTYGHPAGDDCLRKVAQKLKSSLKRTGDIVARYGGEEFVVVMPDTNLKDASNLAAILKSGIGSLKIAHQGSKVLDYITISMGVANLIPNEATSPTVLVEAADKALYKAKTSGRNQYCAYESHVMVD